MRIQPHHLAAALAVTLLVAVVLFSVGGGATGPRPVEGRWNLPVEVRRADPFPREFVNAAGERVVIEAAPRGIVSGTIFADALLLRVCPPERILALHHLSEDVRYSAVADESRAFPRHHGGGAEEILALQPDLVIVSSFSRQETRTLLDRQGCAVLRFLGFASVADIQNNMRAVGYVLGLDDAMESLVAEMDGALERVARGRDERRPWRLLHYEAGRTSGPGTTFDSLLEYVGARNAVAGRGIEGSQSISPEDVLSLDPDALVLGVAPGGEAEVRRGLLQTPGFGELRAVRRDRLVLVPAGWLQSTSHHLARAAQRIAEVLDAWGPP